MLPFRMNTTGPSRRWWLTFLTCCALMISPVATALADETTDTTTEPQVIVLVEVPVETNTESTGEGDALPPESESESLPESGEGVAGDGESGTLGDESSLPPDSADVPESEADPAAEEGASVESGEPVGTSGEEEDPAAGSIESPADTEEQDGQDSQDATLLKTADSSEPETSLMLMSVEEAGLDEAAISPLAAASEADSLSIMSTGIVPTQDTPENVVGVLVGNGVTFSDVTYTGAPSAIGQFTGGTGIIGFEDGIILGSGSILDVVGPNDSSGTTTDHNLPGDADLSLLANGDTEDAAVLTFNFVPAGNQIVFSYVFSSEEYNEYVGSSYNDVFAFYVNGQNCATVQGGAVSINTINNDSNSAQYVDNTDAHLNTQMDGLTVVLTCSATVTPGASNTMKLAIADTGDTALDSNVFIQAKSFTVPTPTPSPAPTEVPTGTPTPTAGEPTKPQQYAQPPAPAPAVAGSVTALPNTGSGTQKSDTHFAMLLAAGLGAGISLAGAIRSSKGQVKA